MRETHFILGALIVVALATHPSPARAGKEPCDEEVDVCVSQMLEKIHQKGWVGIELEWPESDGPPTVTRVIEASPAAAAGLAPGDVLVAVDGLAYADHNSVKVKEAYRKLQPGDAVTYDVVRDGSRRQIEVTLGEVPDAVAAQWVGYHVINHHAHAEGAGDVAVAEKDR